MKIKVIMGNNIMNPFKAFLVDRGYDLGMLDHLYANETSWGKVRRVDVFELVDEFAKVYQEEIESLQKEFCEHKSKLTMTREEKKQLILDAIAYIDDFSGRVDSFLDQQEFKEAASKFSKYYCGADPYKGQLPVFWDVCENTETKEQWVVVPPKEEDFIHLTRRIPSNKKHFDTLCVPNTHFLKYFRILSVEERNKPID